jgi:hypothetical protein
MIKNKKPEMYGHDLSRPIGINLRIAELKKKRTNKRRERKIGSITLFTCERKPMGRWAEAVRLLGRCHVLFCSPAPLK